MMELHRNISVWYVTTFFTCTAFTLPIWVIFNTEVLGLNNTQAFILGILPVGLSAFFEVPTGCWADKYGRAKIYQVGMMLYILSVASFIFITNFYVLLASQVVGAIGLAMQSGGLEALIHDSIKSEDKDAIYTRVHANKIAIAFSSRVATVLLSSMLFTIDSRAPFVVATIAYICGLLVSLLFKEVITETPTKQSSLNHIKETTILLLNKKTLITFLILAVLYKFCSEALFALYQPYFKSLNISISEFGVFYASISTLSVVGALSVAKLMKRFSTLQILLVMMFAVLLTSSLMLLKQPALIYLAIIPSSISFGFASTLINTSIQKLISSRYQATALSVISFLRSFILLASVVAIGVGLDLADISTVNTILATTILICILPFLNTRNMKE